jgi:large subunit ribosomal protein L21
LYAIFETGGKQYKVEEGDIVFLERLGGAEGDEVTFDKVLAFYSEGQIDFGTPYLRGASVVAKVLRHGKDKKIVVFKYKAKKGYRRKKGHRQPNTKVQVERISYAVGGR